MRSWQRTARFTRVTETMVRAVILAAGSSSRTAPVQKLLTSFRGRPLIEYAIEAASAWNPIVVAGPAIASALHTRTDCTVVLNKHPERGMSHSLKIADASIAPEFSLLVLLADKPLVSRNILERVCAERVQVAFPVHASHGTPGHPVFFDVTVRLKIAALPDGDALHRLRDDPSFVRKVVPVLDEGAFFDVDDVTALDAAVARYNRRLRVTRATPATSRRTTVDRQMLAAMRNRAIPSARARSEHTRVLAAAVQADGVDAVAVRRARRRLRRR